MAANEVSNLWLKQLNTLRGSRVKVYLLNGKAYTGRLVDFDDNTMVIGPATENNPNGVSSTVAMDQVTVFRRVAAEEEGSREQA